MPADAPLQTRCVTGCCGGGGGGGGGAAGTPSPASWNACDRGGATSPGEVEETNHNSAALWGAPIWGALGPQQPCKLGTAAARAAPASHQRHGARHWGVAGKPLQHCTKCLQDCHSNCNGQFVRCQAVHRTFAGLQARHVASQCSSPKRNPRHPIESRTPSALHRHC